MTQNSESMDEIDKIYNEAKARGYVSEVSFLVCPELKIEDYVEVWSGLGWYRFKKPIIVK